MNIFKFAVCIFKNHKPVSRKRKKQLLGTYRDLGLDIIGYSAFSNIQRMKEIKNELERCIRCGWQMMIYKNL